jgi:hypothetical protein
MGAPVQYQQGPPVQYRQVTEQEALQSLAEQVRSIKERLDDMEYLFKDLSDVLRIEQKNIETLDKRTKRGVGHAQRDQDRLNPAEAYIVDE